MKFEYPKDYKTFMIGMIARRGNTEIPIIQPPVGPYTSYVVSATKEGYKSIPHKANQLILLCACALSLLIFSSCSSLLVSNSSSVTMPSPSASYSAYSLPSSSLFAAISVIELYIWSDFNRDTVRCNVLLVVQPPALYRFDRALF